MKRTHRTTFIAAAVLFTSALPVLAADRVKTANGVTIVGHGRSSAKAVRNAVALGYRFA